MRTLSVLIPSRTGSRQSEFLQRAMASVFDQVNSPFVLRDVLVGLDMGAEVPKGLVPSGVRWIHSTGKSQAAALNACAKEATGDTIAILEDDDWWATHRLAYAGALLDEFDFTSSTQLEVRDPPSEARTVSNTLRVNDFATPSGWLMTRACWEEVGPFNEEYRYRLDNEWLGRLGCTHCMRAHLVEATAPTDSRLCEQVRPWLASIARYGRSPRSVVAPRLVAHPSPYPLIYRAVHSGSGSYSVENDPQVACVASREEARLRYRFGYIPW